MPHRGAALQRRGEGILSKICTACIDRICDGTEG